MTSYWDAALEILRTKHGAGTLYNPLDDTYCALGAIGVAVLGEDFKRGYANRYELLEDNPVARDMVARLAAVIREQHPKISRYAGREDQAAVYALNDRGGIGLDPQAHADMIAAFEKARANE